MNTLTTRNSLVPTWDEFFFPIEQHFSKLFNDNSDISVTSGYPKMDVITEGNHLVVC